MTFVNDGSFLPKNLQDDFAAIASQLKVTDCNETLPLRHESFASWMKALKHRRLAVVVGETRGDNRRARESATEEEYNKLLGATTSDALAAGKLIANWISRFGLDSRNVEWLVDEFKSTRDKLQQDLIVIGTGEVNLLSLFLNCFAFDLHFGEGDRWPPRLWTCGQLLTVGQSTYQRLHENRGAVMLLRNPWSPNDHYVLWIAGLSGIATTAGALLIEKLCDCYKVQSDVSAGLMFEGTEESVHAEAWLVQGAKETKWLKAKEVMKTDTVRLSEREWNRYQNIAIGAGGNGAVYLGHSASGEEVAIKVADNSADKTAREVRIVRDILVGRNLANVMPYYAAGDVHGRSYVVMARGDRSLSLELHDGTKNLRDAITILRAIINGLAELQNLESASQGVHGIVHRDIKPGNIVLHDGVWKIADFDIAKSYWEATATNTSRSAGTWEFNPPEGWEHHRRSFDSDIYSVGCIAYCLFTGRPPFHGGVEEQRRQHCHEDPPPLPPDAEPIADLVREMLAKDRRQRPTLKQIADRLDLLGRDP